MKYDLLIKILNCWRKKIKMSIILIITQSVIKIVGTGMAGLTISNEEIDDIIKIVKSFKEFGLLIKDVSETIKNEAME